MVSKQVMKIAAALLVALPMTAAAASGADARPPFKKADANGDGKISIKEATDVGVSKSEAKREDIDNDGYLTKADWKFVDMPKKDADKKDADDGGS